MGLQLHRAPLMQPLLGQNLFGFQDTQRPLHHGGASQGSGVGFLRRSPSHAGGDHGGGSSQLGVPQTLQVLVRSLPQKHFRFAHLLKQLCHGLCTRH